MILAMDPGTTETAVLQWDGEQIHIAEILPNKDVADFLPHWQGNIFCEMVACYGMPVGKTVFETVLWIGEFRRVATITKTPFSLVYRQEVKLHHCGSPRAKDGNVIQALKDRYGEKGTKAFPGLTYKLKSHLWQAFAIATWAWDTQPRA